MMGCWGWGWGMGGGWLLMVLFWGLVLVGLVWLIRSLSSQSRGKTALEILQERYARGDIQKEEYEQRKRDISA